MESVVSAGSPATGRADQTQRGEEKMQTFSVPVGYSSWRPTLYGPPLRL